MVIGCIFLHLVFFKNQIFIIVFMFFKFFVIVNICRSVTVMITILVSGLWIL
ncbi:hypothetical protein BCV72DRAFT_231465, partial [Rhizopus microsporus var. microsporus]